MISAISNSCFQYPIEIRKKVALTAIEFLALSSIAAVLISLYGLTTYGYVGIGISCFLGVLDLSLFGFSFCRSSSSSSQYSVRSSNLRFGLSSSYSEEFAQQTLGFSREANGQRPFASSKSTRGASKIPEDEGEKTKTQVSSQSLPYIPFFQLEVEDAMGDDGTPLHKAYVYEQIPLEMDGREVHIYYGVLVPYVRTWNQHYASQMSFEEYMRKLIDTKPHLKEALLAWNVRYFNDRERAETKIFWNEGQAYQIGLDSESSELKSMNPDTYAFVLGKNDLYMAVKKRPTIVHSSFLRGCPVKSAGFITLDERGEIVKVLFYSGHYRPQEKEFHEFYSYLASILSKKQLSKIEFYYKSHYSQPEIPITLVNNFVANVRDQRKNLI